MISYTTAHYFTFLLCLVIFAGATWFGVRAVEDAQKEQPIHQSTEPIKGEYDAIRYLHQLLDEDLSGYVDVRESKEFLDDELNAKGKSKDRLNKFHQDDPQVTVEELWSSWSSSEVHNWTVEMVVEWLTQHVELPQYAEIFRRHSVSGADLPRMASNSPEYLTATLGVRDPIHKRKLSLKATDAVLFGSPKRDPFGVYKYWIFIVSIGIASCGVWFAFSQRRKFNSQMRQVSLDLENFQQLERQLSSLQEKVGKSETASEGTNGERADSSSTDRNRLQEAEEELSVLRDALQRAEQRAESRAWNVPVELELHLRKTYSVELSYFRSKRAAAEKQLQTAKEQCEKLYKKQQTLFGPFRVAHGSQLDTVDDGLVVAKAALMELASDMTERSTRWSRMEILTGLNIVSPNANSDGVYLRRLPQPHFAPPSPSTADNEPSFTRRQTSFPHSGSSCDLADQSSNSILNANSTSKNGNGTRSEQYDPFGRRVSWDADNFSVNSYDSMPININDVRRSQPEAPQGNGATRPPLPLNRTELSAGGLIRRQTVHLDSTVTASKVHSDSGGANGRVGVANDEEERPTRKVPDVRSDVDVGSIVSLDIASQHGGEGVKKKSGLKKLFGK